MIFKSIRSRLTLSFAGIAAVAAIVLGVALLVILQKYYLDQEIGYLRGNAQTISGVGMKMITADAPHDEMQSQIENLAFLSQTRVQVYNLHEQLLYDSGSPQNVNVNLGFMSQMLSPQANSSPSDNAVRIIAVVPQGNVTPPVLETPSAPTQPGKFLFVFRSVKAGGSPFGFDLSSEANTGRTRSKLAVVELTKDPQTSNTFGSVKLSEGPAYGSGILTSVAWGWVVASFIAVLLAAIVGRGIKQAHQRAGACANRCDGAYGAGRPIEPRSSAGAG